MAQGNNYGQSSNGVADESPNMLVYRKVSFAFQKLRMVLQEMVTS